MSDLAGNLPDSDSDALLQGLNVRGLLKVISHLVLGKVHLGLGELAGGLPSQNLGHGGLDPCETSHTQRARKHTLEVAVGETPLEPRCTLDLAGHLPLGNVLGHALRVLDVVAHDQLRDVQLALLGESLELRAHEE